VEKAHTLINRKGITLVSTITLTCVIPKVAVKTMERVDVGEGKAAKVATVSKVMKEKSGTQP